MILVGGENLIDFIQGEDQNGLPTYQANPGGGPFNCAKAMARQGQNVGYLTPISNDTLGTLLAEDLTASGAQILAPRNSAPTSLAVVSLANGQAQYQFYREQTAERMVTLDALLQRTPPKEKSLFLGSLAITDGPDAEAWTAYFIQMKTRGIFTALDPNIRAPFIKDRTTFLTRLDTLLAHTDLLKLSDEDLGWLYPDHPLEDAARLLFTHSSATLMIVTAGGEGAFALHNNVITHVPAARVRHMQDTVGAGDTFMATLLAQLDTDKAASLDTLSITRILTRAATAAALNCEKTGCQPPTLTEINARLAAG